jgi:hypothetical protein
VQESAVANGKPALHVLLKQASQALLLNAKRLARLFWRAPAVRHGFVCLSPPYEKPAMRKYEKPAMRKLTVEQARLLGLGDAKEVDGEFMKLLFPDKQKSE